MNYNNPGSFIPNADFRVNPMQGAFAGEQQGIMENLLDRSYRDSDQEYLKNLHDLEISKAEDPAKKAEFAARAAEAGNKTTIAQSPLSVQAPLSALSTQVDDNNTKMGSNAVAREAQRNSLAVQLNEEMKSLPPDYYVKNPQAANAHWQDWKQKFGAVGVNLPDSPSPEFRQQLAAKAQAAVQTAPFQQEVAMQTLKNTGTSNVANIETGGRITTTAMNNRAQRDIQTGHDQSRLAVAEMAQADDRRIMTTLQNLAKGAGPGPANAAAEGLAEMQAEKEANADPKVLTMKMNNDMQGVAMYTQQLKDMILKRWKQSIDTIVKSSGTAGVANSAVDNARAAPAAPAAAVSGDSEAKIKAVMAGNPSASREDVINAMKAAGHLSKDYK
jgi:hypothetical protein